MDPAGVLYAASLWLSNSAYLYLSVSFIQMTKSLMPGLVYATGVFMGTEQFSKANAANMALIAFGVVVCAIGEVNLVFKGVMQQLAALLFEVRAPLADSGAAYLYAVCMHTLAASIHMRFLLAACHVVLVALYIPLSCLQSCAGCQADSCASAHQQQGAPNEPLAEPVLCVTSMSHMSDCSVW